MSREALQRSVWEWTTLLPSVLWSGMILWIASRPKVAFFANAKVIYGMPRRLLQYPYHVSVFFVLAILLFLHFWPQGGRQDGRQPEMLVLLGSLIVSGCSELIQLGVPTRTPTMIDLMLDLFGTLLGILFMRCLLRPTNKMLGEME